MSNIAEYSLKQDDGPIDVLLVDDNEKWVTFAAGELERDNPNMAVVVATSATDALLALQEMGSVDCVVTDYRMPEINGLELVERVNNEWDRIPAILITGEGSEDVAARAIEAGVFDYLKKDPRTDQTSLLATKIRSAVTRHRLQLAVEESEDQYRTVTEQSRDAIFIWQDDAVVFCNRGLETFISASRDEIMGGEFDWTAIHPDDRDRLRAMFSQWNNGDVDDETHQVRLLATDGNVRYCEFTGREITHENDRAVLVTIHDVTQRKLRERALQRERQLNRTVQELSITARSRAEFEQALVRELAEDQYELVWIGERRNGSVLNRAAAGETEYLDHLLPVTNDDAQDDDPVIMAARRGDARFVDDVAALFQSDWCTAALDRGLTAAAGLPLRHNDVVFGVLGIYAGVEYAFDEVDRRLLTELADTIAFAIHNLQRDRTLTSDQTVEATLRLDHSAHYLADFLSTVEETSGNAELTVLGTIAQEKDQYIQYLTLDEITVGAFVAAAEADPRIESTKLIGSGPNSRVQVVTTECPPEAALAAMGAIVRPSTITAEAATVRIEIAPERQLREVVAGIDGPAEAITVESVLQREHLDPAVVPRYVDTSTLTEKQETALRAAIHQGYFERPRLRSAEEIATSLEIAHSTFLQHLRIGQRKIFTSLFG